ncbi:endonuclease [Deinococcus arenicola]|uniref:Serine protease n=1 Tax=Deinococcus arenicola TaxID=2994950 RepID=A0ABU4DS81_9DEIO|nr:endonuclease [Deinococcus sp. ZS9-10]MDV6375293.1 endonuclease [Deinococcus sp. ZS9-10]
MDIPPEVLEQTHARYVSRDAQRTRTLERLNVGGPMAANTDAHLEARLTRLGVPYADACALAEGRESMAAVTERLPGKTRIQAERVLGANDLVGVAYLDLARSASRAVGRVVLKDGRGRTVGFGTGWLCSPHAILTNHHVLEDAASARTSVIEFNYELLPGGELATPITLTLDPDTLFVTSEALDYSLVAVRGDTSAFGWLPLIASADKTVLGEALSIVQHPGGETKQIALRENRLIDLLPNHLHYETDTAPGSSGSPVFNDAWEVVALHHSGVPRTDSQGRTLKRDGQPLQPGDPDSAIDWIANEGVRVSVLVGDLRTRADVANDSLVAEILRAERPTVLASVPVAPGEGGVLEAVGTLDLGVVTPGADGTVNWPVTLKIKVKGGEAGPSEPAPQPQPEPQPQQPGGYLNPQDEAVAAAYYAGLATAGTPQNRFLALSQLVTRTHAQKPRYSPSTELYPAIDLWPDGKLRSLYSAREHTPEEFIAADQAAQTRRTELAAREGLSVDTLEDAFPYNCEHVVPQSWFAKREPMRGDLHHLFACEPDCNSFRGNTPYFDFPDYGEALRSDCGRRDPGEFEPAHGKGAAARATLYFLLRYPGVVRQYSARHLETLLAWHTAQPPGDWEKHRNALIFARQGNRNPLIDRPQWSAEVDFGEGLGR